MNSKRYRVEIVEIDTGKVVATVGHNLTATQADRRVATAIGRIDTEHYFVSDVEEHKRKGK